MVGKKEIIPKRKRHEIRRERIRKQALRKKLDYSAMLAVVVIVVISAVVIYPLVTKTNNDRGKHDEVKDQDGTTVIGTEVGQIAPGFNMTDTGCHDITLWSHRSSVVVLDFMVTWCGPCKEEIEHLKEVCSMYDKSAVKIISIDVDNRESSTILEDFKHNQSCEWEFKLKQ